MGIFNFFKNKKQEQEPEEKIEFQNIDKYIKKKKQEIKHSQKQPLEQVKQNLSELTKKLNENIFILENLDLKQKKAPERAKLIVKQNLFNFINYLEKLIFNLQDLEEQDFQSFETLIKKINIFFSEFEKKSLMSFQKSTFLIGQELGAVRENIAGFFRDFNKIITQNQSSINKIKTMSIIKEKLNQTNNLENSISENKQATLEINQIIENQKNTIQDIKEQIKTIENSPEYIKQVNTKQESENQKTKLIIELQGLRESIDFKALAKAYHSTENKMTLIKEYKENFKETFEKHSNEEFLDLVDIKEINQKLVKQKLEIINKIKQDITELKNTLSKKDPIKDLENQISQINNKIIELNPEIQKKQKLIQKFQENKEQIKQEIIEGLKEISVVVRD